jgi:hypothetical protein
MKRGSIKVKDLNRAKAAMLLLKNEDHNVDVSNVEYILINQFCLAEPRTNHEVQDFTEIVQELIENFFV